MDELCYCAHSLNKFSETTQKYFKQTEMTFNVHLLGHMAKAVFNWSPLWAWSTFGFEGANRLIIIKATKCGKGVNLQNLRYMNINKNLETLKKELFEN